jgi:2-amino-4-hydroxy-6-hydroxymethyldihydropteridine diphosphokinase
MINAYLLLGTNLGDRKLNLQSAAQLLNSKDIKIINRSSIYETAAWGYLDQPSFFNQALEVSTSYSPEELLLVVKLVEKEMGRIANEKWQERLIDVDILYYDNKVIESEKLKIPHPELQNRKFALIPLVDIAEEYVHPTLNKTSRELLQECKDQLEVKLVE